MFPVSSSVNHLTEASGVEHRTVQVELHDTDITAVESIALDSPPKLGPGDKVYIRSGASGVYRRIARVEPIAGGGVLIWLDSGYLVRRDRGQIAK